MLSDAIRFISEVPFFVSVFNAIGSFLRCCPLFDLVPTFALMPCPRMMFVSGGNCVSIELRIVLKFLSSMLSTGWYIEHSVMFSSPLIVFPLSSTFGKVSGTPMILPSIFLPVSSLITSLPFVCALSQRLVIG